MLGCRSRFLHVVTPFLAIVTPVIASNDHLASQDSAKTQKTEQELYADELRCIAKHLDRLGGVYERIINYDGKPSQHANEVNVFDALISRNERSSLREKEDDLNNETCAPSDGNCVDLDSHPQLGDPRYHVAMLEFQAAAKRLFMVGEKGSSSAFNLLWPATNPSTEKDGDLKPLAAESGKTGSAVTKHLRIPEIMIKRKLKDHERRNLLSGTLVKVGRHIGQQVVKGENTKIILTLGIFTCLAPDNKVYSYTVQERVGGKMVRLHMQSPHGSTKPLSIKSFDMKGLWYRNDDGMMILHPYITNRMANYVLRNRLGTGLLEGIVNTHSDSKLDKKREFLVNLKKDSEYLGGVTESQDYSWFAIVEEIIANVENEEMCEAANGLLVSPLGLHSQKNWMTEFTDAAEVAEAVKRQWADKTFDRLDKDLNNILGEKTAHRLKSFVSNGVTKALQFIGKFKTIKTSTTTTSTTTTTTTTFLKEREEQTCTNSGTCIIGSPEYVSVFCVHHALIDFYGGYGLRAHAESQIFRIVTGPFAHLFGENSKERLEEAIGMVQKGLEKDILAEGMEKVHEGAHDDDDDIAEEHANNLEQKKLIKEAFETSRKYLQKIGSQQTQVPSKNYSERLYSTIVVQLLGLGNVMERYNEQTITRKALT